MTNDPDRQLNSATEQEIEGERDRERFSLRSVCHFVVSPSPLYYVYPIVMSIRLSVSEKALRSALTLNKLIKKPPKTPAKIHVESDCKGVAVELGGGERAGGVGD